MDTKE